MLYDLTHKDKETQDDKIEETFNKMIDGDVIIIQKIDRESFSDEIEWVYLVGDNGKNYAEIHGDYKIALLVANGIMKRNK